MLRLLLPFALAILCPFAFAQTYYSPHSSYGIHEGYGAGGYLFAQPNSRTQLCDGNIRGKVVVVTNLSFRHDRQVYGEHAGMGRTWSSVSIDFADCDLDRVHTNMTANLKSTPTRAFQSPLKLPTLWGQKTSAGWPLRFPLRVPWISNPKADVLLDFQLKGGTLANRAIWSNAPVHYTLDSYYAGDTGSVTGLRLGNPKAACRDSGATYPAYVRVIMSAHTRYHVTPKRREKFEFEMSSHDTAQNAPVFHALDLKGGTAGTTFPGIACSKLFVAASPSLLVAPQRANSAGAVPGHSFGIPDGLFPYVPAVSGTPIYAQALWRDSRSGALRLSHGIMLRLPRLPPFRLPLLARRRAIWQPYPGARVRHEVRYTFNPIFKLD